MAKRHKVDPIRNPTLFEMGKPEEPARLVSEPEIERQFYEPGLLLGTSSFTAAGWPESFYPVGMKPADYLTYYASKFQTVGIDSTYYGPPSALTVTRWREYPACTLFARWSAADTSSGVPNRRSSGCSGAAFPA